MKDKEFIRGGVPMTKEPVRALILDFLNISKAKTFLDVGAGTGSVSIQAAYTNPNLRVNAIERKKEGLDLIRKNAEKFGLENIKIIEGQAPVYEIKEKFDCIYIGGSGGRLREIIDWSHDLLPKGGRLVLSFILIENMMEAFAYLKETGWQEVDAVKLDCSNIEKLGSGHYFKPNNPSFVIRAERK